MTFGGKTGKRQSGELPLLRSLIAVSGCLVTKKSLHLTCLFFPFFHARRRVMIYSIDLRRKVVSVYEKQKSLRKTAELLDVSYKFVQGLIKRWKTEGTLEPRPHKGGNPPKIQEVHMPFLISMIDDENDLSLEEMCDRLHEKFNLKIAPSTLCETLARLKISRKKKRPAIRRRIKRKISQRQ
jgi:transposase